MGRKTYCLHETPVDILMELQLYINIYVRKRLFAGTLPANKNLFAGTVPENENLFAGTPQVGSIFIFSPRIGLFGQKNDRS